MLSQMPSYTIHGYALEKYEYKKVQAYEAQC